MDSDCRCNNPQIPRLAAPPQGTIHRAIYDVETRAAERPFAQFTAHPATIHLAGGFAPPRASLTTMEPNTKIDPRNSAGKGSRDAVQFECPSCKGAIHIVVSRLRRGSKVQCAACKDEHTLTASDVPRLLAEHRKRLAKLNL